MLCSYVAKKMTKCPPGGGVRQRRFDCTNFESVNEVLKGDHSNKL